MVLFKLEMIQNTEYYFANQKTIETYFTVFNYIFKS